MLNLGSRGEGETSMVIWDRSVMVVGDGRLRAAKSTGEV